ncbi:helix-turn-helix transcriptional regulator [Salmonella enterica]|nr:helix-turn-helix transcriptional regulator [Salmonella enterica]
MPSNKSVIVLAQSHFFVSGLKNLMADSSLQLQFLHAKTVEGILTLQKIPGVSMIMVASDSCNPAKRAQAQAQVRHLHWLMTCGRMSRTPCLLLPGDMSISVSGETFLLTRGQMKYDLEILLCSILTHRELYLDSSSWSSLSERQKIILKGTLSGQKVEELAEQMNILPGTVLAHRDNLIKKLELRNSLELMSLNISYFSDIHGNRKNISTFAEI